MSDATLRASIKNILTSVPGAGQVHDYERWAADMAQFIAFFRDPVSKKVFGWEITRAAVPRIERIGNRFKVTHSYLVKGYYGLKDAEATEKIFNTVVDAMLLQLLGGIPGTEGTPLPRVDLIQPRMFGGVLCHYAEIRLDNVAEIVTPAAIEEVTDLLRVGLNYYLQPGDDTADAADLVDLPELPKG